MRFEKQTAGLNYKASSQDAVIYTLRSDGAFAGTGAALDGSNSSEVVTATGWVTTARNGSPMSQIVSGEWICVWDGWTPLDRVQLYSPSQAQKLINKITKNNVRILENNLICARFAHKLTSAQKQKLYNLQARLNNRNEELLNGGLVTPQTQAAPDGYAELQSYLDSFMSRGGVGSLTVAIVISAIVVASLATAAYFCYRYYASESEQDVKFSDELTKTLTSKLTEEEYEQLLSETRGIVTKAKIRQRFKNSTAWLIVAAAAIGAGFLLKIFNRQ